MISVQITGSSFNENWIFSVWHSAGHELMEGS